MSQALKPRPGTVQGETPHAERKSTGSRVLDEIADVIGDEAAHALLLELGGQRIYVPRHFREDHAVVRAIGVEAAALLSEHFYMMRVDLPITLRRHAIVRSMWERVPRPMLGEIAAAAGLSRRAVFDVLNARPRQGRAASNRPATGS